ncbi:hypothetical protein LguiB_027933 [Lonicera macranthoides]
MPSLVEKCKTNTLPAKFVKEYLTNEMIVRNTEPHIIAKVFCFYVIGYGVFFQIELTTFHSMCYPLLRTSAILESTIRVQQFLHVCITD